MDAPPCSQLFSFRSESLRRLSGSTVNRPDGWFEQMGEGWVKTKREMKTNQGRVAKQCDWEEKLNKNIW